MVEGNGTGRRKRVLRALAIGVWLLLAVLAWNFLCYLTDLIIRRPTIPQPARIQEKATAEFSARNPRGQMIKGWYYRGKPGAAALLLCHGHAVDHHELSDVFAFLQPLGFDIFFLDFRAHGESEGEFTSIGREEWEDIDAILTEATNRGFLATSTPLAAYGRSMGAATLGNGGRRLPRIGAFILESMFSELRTIAANDLKHLLSLPDCFLVDLVFWNAEYRSGLLYYPNKPSEEIASIHPRPLLLIHDALDPRVTPENFARLTVVASFATALVFPDSGHIQAHRRDPQRFEREFLGFLASAGIRIP